MYLFFSISNLIFKQKKIFMLSVYQLRQLPESIIVETTEYKCLQSHFSVLYNEFMLMRNQLLESTGLLQNSKNTHLRQMEGMEVSYSQFYCKK